MKYFITFFLLLSFVNTFSQEAAVRFVIGSFVVENANSDLSRRLRTDFESALFDVADQCLEQISYIPDEREEMIQYFTGIREKYRREFGFHDDSLVVPIQGNYIVMVRIRGDNFGIYMKVGIFEKVSGDLNYVSEGISESSIALNELYDRDNRSKFIEKGLKEAFGSSQLKSWIKKNVNDSFDFSVCRLENNVRILVGTPIRNNNWKVMGLAKKAEEYKYTGKDTISPKGEIYYEIYLDESSSKKALIWSKECELL